MPDIPISFGRPISGDCREGTTDSSVTPGIVLAALGNFAIVGPMTLLVLPLNALLGGVMLHHQRHVFRSLNLRIRKNKRGLLFYFFFYQFVMSPISLGGYALEAIRARRAW